MATSNYVSGANSKIVLNTNETTVATIRGLNSMTPPLGFSRKSVEVEEFGRDISTKVATGAAYDDLTFAGSFVVGDTNGQDLLRQYATANTPITNIRFHLDATNFCALDLANDPSGCYQVTKFSPGTGSKSGVYPLSLTMSVGGKSILYSKHVTGATLAVTTSTITDSASGFVTAGFAVGDVILIDGSVANKAKTGIVTIVVAGTLTFAAATWVADASPGAGCAVHGGK